MALGWPSVEYGLRNISSKELSEWRAYVRRYGPINPIERADWAMAQIAAILANQARNPKKRRKPYDIEDFMPKFETKRTPNYISPAGGVSYETADSMVAKIALFNKAMGGRDMRKDKAD